jgi:hypothetical protein
VTSHRSVDLEEMRTWYSKQADHWSLRIVAAAAGVGRTTLRNIVAVGTRPHPPVRRLLALHYLAHVERDAPDVESILCAIPTANRAAAAARLTYQIARIHTDYGVDPPSWTCGALPALPADTHL